ncbi:hypothetical protein J2X31_002175 [Flavobacterium arsenatis]|uniref:Lipoprotein n=1 Tax=Flavobacterium arsenatis TaxID=1484332 RepID=A0ABU1TQB8_9FLAO|nr:hypothetical protein [Flavobacterium arsenatis]MDR6968160.1 hypothetical protein [Flavobacterium arsenatis]
MYKLIIFFLTVFALQSCKEKTQKSPKVKPQEKVEIQNKQPKKEIFKGTFEFISYDDNYDYMLLNARKDKEIYGFVNDRNNDRTLLRGDICEIQWEKDTIYIAGDGDTPEIADWLVSIKKIKDGNVSKFRKEYKKQIKYHWHEDNYAQNYLDEIYLLAEYYIANSKNKLISNAVQNKENIEYSVEKRTENNRDYDALGIGFMSEYRFAVMQWVYIERENKKIFELDVTNDELVEFK